MGYCVAVFWSRSEAFSFSNLLARQSLPTALVPTPKEAGRTCGLSVKFPCEYVDIARKSLHMFSSKSFGGFFSFSFKNGQKSVQKI